MSKAEILAQEALDTVCENMPEKLQPSRAPVEARRFLLDTAQALPETQRDRAHEALETLIEARFGPQDVPETPPLASIQSSDKPDLESLVEAAIRDAFSTTFDGSKERADTICDRAWSEAQRVLKQHGTFLGLIGKWRLKRLAREIIARERAQLFS